MKKPDIHPYILLWVLLTFTLALVVANSFTDTGFNLLGYRPKQAPFRELLTAESEPEETLDTAAAAVDTVPEEKGDTVPHNILYFGDSMTILPANRMADYARQNGHTLTSVTWISSTTFAWAETDTLDYYINKVKPDFIFVVLGSNELSYRDLSKPKANVEAIVKKIGDIPFIWIGPPNWKPDTGLNDMLEATLPKGSFFRTDTMSLPRGRDHIHPTPKGGVMWMDSVVRWMPKSWHPIKLEMPDSTIQHSTHTIYTLKPKR